MRITKYNCILDDNLHNTLVKEDSYNYEFDIVDTAEKIVKILNSWFKLNILAEEYVYMMSLNSKGKVTGLFEVSHGTVMASFASPREIMIRALLSGAVGIVLVHNHPSGEPKPSKMDIIMAKRINEACDLMEISLFDCIIIGRKDYYSFKENGLLDK